MSRTLSPKLLLAAAAAFAASAASLPALAAPGDQPAGQQQNQPRPTPLRAQILFNLVDTNGDGAIDATEAAALQKAIFGALDANHDGKLTPDEFRQVANNFMDDHPRLKAMKDHRGGPGMRGPGMRGPGMWGPPGFHRPGPDGQRQGALPGDQQPGPDGQIGPDGQQPAPDQLGDNATMPPVPGDDAQAPQPQNFASLDKNGDGVVTPDEFAAGKLPIPGILQATK
jgi:hypothetical protein